MTQNGYSPTLRAIIWMIGTLASFLAMAIAVRELSSTMATFEILFFRSLIGLLILLPLVLRNGGRALYSRRPWLHVARNTVHFGAQYSWTLGVTLLPLAQVFALEFTTPLWVLLLAVTLLGERLTALRVVAVVGGFIGILVILRPGIGIFNPAAFIVLGAAVGFAGSVIMVKTLTRTDAVLTIVFYMMLLQLPMGLLPALYDWITPSWSDLPWLLLVGVAGLSAHYAMTQAFRLVDVTVILPIDFLRLPLAAVLGFMLYGEALDRWVFIGAALIFGANYFMVRRESASG